MGGDTRTGPLCRRSCALQLHAALPPLPARPQAASGLAQSVEQAAGVLMSKAKDAAAAAARAVCALGGGCGQQGRAAGVCTAHLRCSSKSCCCPPPPARLPPCGRPQVGLGSERQEMSEGSMGAAGKMEHYAQTGATSA